VEDDNILKALRAITQESDYVQAKYKLNFYLLNHNRHLMLSTSTSLSMGQTIDYYLHQKIKAGVFVGLFLVDCWVSKRMNPGYLQRHWDFDACLGIEKHDILWNYEYYVSKNGESHLVTSLITNKYIIYVPCMLLGAK
jgi:hypothetical protein